MTPKFIEIEGKRLLWRDVLQLRRERVRAAARAEQPALFELKARQIQSARTLARPSVKIDRLGRVPEIRTDAMRDVVHRQVADSPNRFDLALDEVVQFSKGFRRPELRGDGLQAPFRRLKDAERNPPLVRMPLAAGQNSRLERLTP